MNIPEEGIILNTTLSIKYDSVKRKTRYDLVKNRPASGSPVLINPTFTWIDKGFTKIKKSKRVKKV